MEYEQTSLCWLDEEKYAYQINNQNFADKLG